MPSKLEEKLRSTEFTHEEEEEAIEAVERSGISLRYILDFHEVWQLIEERDEELDNLHKQLLKESRYEPDNFIRIIEVSIEDTNTLYNILDNYDTQL
jgi:hypothetical protein